MRRFPPLGPRRCWGSLAALPLAGLALLVTGLLFAGHALASILLFPIMSLVCFGKCEGALPLGGDGGADAGRQKVGLRPVAVELLKLVIVFGLMGFIWQLYAVDTTVSPAAKGVFFSLGFIMAAVVLRLFVRYSAGMDVGSFVRWAFPIAAVGLLFVSLGTPPLMAVACVLFAGTQASFEAMMRIRAIGLARRYGAPLSLAVLGWGFAAINIGATAGETLFQVMFPDGAVARADVLVAAVMALLVIVGAIAPEASAKKPAGPCGAEPPESRPSDCARRAQAMAARYGLSAREREVLALLLEGRSGPVVRESLGLSKSTVDTHIRHIYQKSGAESRQDLIDLALGVDGGQGGGGALHLRGLRALAGPARAHGGGSGRGGLRGEQAGRPAPRHARRRPEGGGRLPRPARRGPHQELRQDQLRRGPRHGGAAARRRRGPGRGGPPGTPPASPTPLRCWWPCRGVPPTT